MTTQSHKPDERSRKQVTLMAGIGIKQDDIARIIGISDVTLRKYYAKELAESKSILNTQVASNLFRIATSSEKGAVSAAIFWMKTRAGWKETVNLSNEDGSLKPEPVQVAVMAALKKVHDDA